ncbi:MAG: GNAT family N-acetyltransferase [Rhizobiaceae bacterium]|nr:GNAT family N-acetyltransferase [Rhizobiaceae bacterium]
MIEICRDADKILSFMTLPEIYRYAGEYGGSVDNVQISDNESCFWLSFTSDGEVVGMTGFHKKNTCTVEFHPYILRVKKHLYNEMVQEIFTWFVGNMPEIYIKLNAVIPEIHKGAIKAAEIAGMKLEGVDRMSIRTKEGVCDRINYGITREEIGYG